MRPKWNSATFEKCRPVQVAMRVLSKHIIYLRMNPVVAHILEDYGALFMPYQHEHLVSGKDDEETS